MSTNGTRSVFGFPQLQVLKGMGVATVYSLTKGKR